MSADRLLEAADSLRDSEAGERLYELALDSSGFALALADWLNHAAVSAGVNRSPYVDEHLRQARLVADAILGEA